MPTRLEAFEEICRRAHVVDESSASPGNSHPFEARNIYPHFPKKTKKLFDDGYYSESAFEALKFLDKTVQFLAGSKESGFKLMMQVLGGQPPAIKLNSLTSQSEVDEQEGYKFMFAGIMSAIRNPKGHEHSIEDDPDTCLDYLTLISMLVKKIESAGYSVPSTTSK